ncbi:hypothetical protein CXP34_02425 [Ralstonia mannitolilytica]|nr:hypothetical protein CXP34_02425 [Ralstonia mannitolilytica]
MTSPTSSTKIEITIDGEDKTADLQRFADAIGLERAARGRYSAVILLELYARMMNPNIPGDPRKVVAEINALEGRCDPVGTKPASEFSHPPLKGLWHKHYFFDGLPSLVTNIRLGLGKTGTKRLVDEIFDPSVSEVITEEKINRLATEVVHGTLDRRREAQRLTGEWIVFARHNGENYYLCLGTHDSGDDAIFGKIRELCPLEFPFLTGMFGT